MKTLSESSAELEHVHLTMTRDKKAMTVMVKDRLTIVAVLDADHVDFALHADCGWPFAVYQLPLSAFDEILEMIISFG